MKNNLSIPIVQTTNKALLYYGIFFLITVLPHIFSYAKKTQSITSEISFYYNLNDIEKISSEIETLITDSNQKQMIDIRYEKATKKSGLLNITFNDSSLTALPATETFVKQLKTNSNLLFYRENFKFLLSNNLPNFNSGLTTYIGLFFLFFIIWKKYFSSYEDKGKLKLIVNKKAFFLKLFSLSLKVLLLVILIQIIGVILRTMGLVVDADTQNILMNLNAKPFVFIFIAIFLAPVVEEIVFRGIVYRIYINNNFPKFGAIIVSGLFALLHQLPILSVPYVDKIVNFLIIFSLSILLCKIYRHENQLWAPIFAHALFNGINISFMVIF